MQMIQMEANHFMGATPRKLSSLKLFDVLKYKVIMPFVSQRLVPSFLNYVRRLWKTADWLVHPETQALLEAKQPVIFAVWHGQMFTLMHPTWLHLQPDPYILISQSRDGDFITAVAEGIGFRNTIRGAHGRGGTEAALYIKRLVKEGRGHIICLLDGPKGPRHKAKAGIVLLAQQLQVPIVPVAGVTPKHWFKFNSAWDAFEVPNPYQHAKMSLGAPIVLPLEASRHEVMNQVNAGMAEHFHATQAYYPSNPNNIQNPYS
jgi:lysophospholipid acyltransferase (LPLAT)-like uncharacterized protein